MLVTFYIINNLNNNKKIITEELFLLTTWSIFFTKNKNFIFAFFTNKPLIKTLLFYI
jgi:hypothetical protein